MEDNIIEVLKNSYCIDVESVEKSEESTDGNVYIVTEANSGTRYALKVYVELQQADTMAELHTYLNGIKLEAPRVIKGKDKNVISHFCNSNNEKRYVICYSFADGEKLGNLELTNEKIIAISKYLRRLHSITQNELGLKSVPFEIESNRQSVLHFDITKHNIFFDDEKICFIDFDDAKFGPSVCDIAIALTNLFISKSSGVDIEGMKLFIDSYYGDDDKTKQEELTLVKRAALCWLKSIINNPNFDTSTRSGLENKIEKWGRTHFLEFTFATFYAI